MQDNEEKLLIDNSPFAIGFHQKGKIKYINKAGLRLFGAGKSEELIGRPIKDLIPPDLMDSFMEYVKRIQDGDKVVYPREDKYLRLDGSTVDVEITAAPMIYNGKPAIQVMAIDISEKKKAEIEWEAIFNGIPNPIIIMDSGHNILSFNRMTQIKVNKPASEILNKKCWEIFHGLDAAGPAGGCPFEKMMLTKGIETFDMEMEGPGGIYSVFCTPIYDDNGRIEKIVHIAVDIIDRKKAEDIFKKLLNEKEILLKESNHRILNTLNTVSSMLEIKSNEINGKTVQAFHDMSNRIHTMGKVYRHLLQTDDYKSISIKEYLSSLICDIVSFYPDSRNITIEKNIEDIPLDSRSVSTIGMIVNEIITNSFKYAFPDNSGGIISINLSRSGSMINMEVFDNGVGFAYSKSGIKKNGLGISLINAMTAQLGGKMELKKKNGAGYFFKIPYKPK